MENDIKRHYESYFTNPWCPLTGELFSVDPVHNSPEFECYKIIIDARFILMNWCDYVRIDGFYSELLKNAFARMNKFYKNPCPCDKCKKSKLGLHNYHLPCDDTCKKYQAYIDRSKEQVKAYRYLDAKFFTDPYNRVRLLYARGMFDNHETIEDHTLWWPNHSEFTSAYGSPEGHTLASVWERSIEQAKEWTRFIEEGQTRGIEVFWSCESCEKSKPGPTEEEMKTYWASDGWHMVEFPDYHAYKASWEGKRSPCDQTMCDYEPPGYIILSILAISEAWRVLRDIIWIGRSERSPDILENTYDAQQLLSKANELLADMKRTKLIEQNKRLEADAQEGVKSRVRRKKGIKKAQIKAKKERDKWNKLADAIRDKHPSYKDNYIATLLAEEEIKDNRRQKERRLLQKRIYNKIHFSTKVSRPEFLKK